jgi:hypothetical protein
MASLRILQGGRVMFTEKYSNGITRRVIWVLNAGSKYKTYRNGNDNLIGIHERFMEWNTKGNSSLEIS